MLRCLLTYESLQGLQNFAKDCNIDWTTRFPYFLRYSGKYFFTNLKHKFMSCSCTKKKILRCFFFFENSCLCFNHLVQGLLFLLWKLCFLLSNPYHHQIVKVFLREGYTVKFFFKGISWNNNLTLISQCIFTLNSN